MADPDSAKVSGILNATFPKTYASVGAGGTVTTFIFNFNANGQFDKVKVVANPNIGSSASARLRGTASITYTTEPGNPEFAKADSGGPILYKVRGFKQSEASG